MTDTKRTFGYKAPLDSTRISYMLVLSLANFSASYIKVDQL